MAGKAKTEPRQAKSNQPSPRRRDLVLDSRPMGQVGKARAGKAKGMCVCVPGRSPTPAQGTRQVSRQGSRQGKVRQANARA